MEKEKRMLEQVLETEFGPIPIVIFDGKAKGFKSRMSKFMVGINNLIMGNSEAMYDHLLDRLWIPPQGNYSDSEYELIKLHELVHVFESRINPKLIRRKDLLKDLLSHRKIRQETAEKYLYGKSVSEGLADYIAIKAQYANHSDITKTHAYIRSYNLENLRESVNKVEDIQDRDNKVSIINTTEIYKIQEQCMKDIYNMKDAKDLLEGLRTLHALSYFMGYSFVRAKDYLEEKPLGIIARELCLNPPEEFSQIAYAIDEYTAKYLEDRGVVNLIPVDENNIDQV